MKNIRIILTFLIVSILITSAYTQITGTMTSVSLQVAGVCGMCKERIEKNAVKVSGVEDASWDVETHMLTVRVSDDKYHPMDLHQQLAKAGHATGILPADKEAYDKLPLCCHYKDPENPHKANQEVLKTESKPISIRVAGVCGMCKERIEKTALASPGVVMASWEADDQYLTIRFNEDAFSEMDLHKNLAAAGHETDLYEADEEAYNQLPLCCQYKDPENPHLMESQNNDTPDIQTDHEFSGIEGKVYEKTDNEELVPLIGANLVWLDTENGTSSGLGGEFFLESDGHSGKLVVSYVGYQTDTLEYEWKSGESIDIILTNTNNLDVVEIIHRKKTTEVSMIDPIKVHKIGEGELLKAACCNLSESFTTNPSIDVSFTDAVTGTRKIEMLGLAGRYVQITRESMPDIRGLAAIQGLTYTPGPWIEGIQMNMGTGSVANGYESMTGQINVELRKPEESDPFYLNLYRNAEGRSEANLNLSHSFNDQFSSALLLHGSDLSKRSDHNEDGFMDMPVGSQFIALNRWKYKGNDGLNSQIGIKATYIDKISGQTGFEPDGINPYLWGATQNTKRLEAWMKIGKVFPARPYSSLGFQVSGVYHDQLNDFGSRTYNATQQTFYANLIYQSIFSSSVHQYRTGMSFNYDKIGESVSDTDYLRNEKVPGAFFEYTFKPDDKFSLVSGIRGDWHNNYGFFFTPRLNVKYAFSENTVLRGAAGKGLRTANIFSENIGFFASSRNFTVMGASLNTPYGLDPEVAWNFGLNLTQVIRVFSQDLVFSVDGYHTRFENQVVVDLEQTGRISFYNLEGKSFSNSIQAQVDFSPVEKFDIRMAYRFNDVKTDFLDIGLLEKPLSSRHRAFINFGYSTENNWKFDLTLNWQGKNRIPDTSGNPEPYQLEDYSPDFYLVNAQISREWNKVFELYIGGENLLNFRQENPILAAGDPFGPNFDASLIWGPVFGRNIYAGLRYRMK